MIALKGAIRDFYDLLIVPRTVSNTYAQVARAESCGNHVQHIDRLSRETCDDLIERRKSRFIRSPHCATNRLQHVRSSGEGGIVCRSRATHRPLITGSMCATWYEGTAQLLSLNHIYYSLFFLKRNSKCSLF